MRLHLRPYVTLRMNDARLGEGHDAPCGYQTIAGTIEIPAAGRLPSLRAVRARKGRLSRGRSTSEDLSYRVTATAAPSTPATCSAPATFTVDRQTVNTSPRAMRRALGSCSLRSERDRHGGATRLKNWCPPPRCRRTISPCSFSWPPINSSMQPAPTEERALAQAAGRRGKDRDRRLSLVRRLGPRHDDQSRGIDALHRPARRKREPFCGPSPATFEDGLIPNLFPEGSRRALYHTADATLWYFHALDRYLTATQDRETLMQLYPTLKEA